MTRAKLGGAWALLANYAVLLVLVAGAVFLAFSTSTFATVTNLTNVLQQVSMVGIIAMGMTMLLISRNFDLSVGANVVLSSVIGASLINSIGTGAGIVATLVVATALGAINGFTVTVLRVNSLVATLGTGLVFSGLALVLSGTAPVVLEDDSLKEIMATEIISVPLPGILFAGAIAAATWLLHCTVLGRRLFAIGSNPDAARYAGIHFERTVFAPFVVIGICCGVASLILMGLLNSASPTAATTWPLDVIAAAVIGGVSIAGGRGNIGMAVVGVLLIGVVANGFNLLDVDPNYRGIFTGAVIVGAVAADQFLQRGWSAGLRRRAL
jgi:ribose/xylose/arabinose/galactoside ABC-type transport system permease subunit